MLVSSNAIPANRDLLSSVKVQSSVFWVSCVPWLKLPLMPFTLAHSNPGSRMRPSAGSPNV